MITVCPSKLFIATVFLNLLHGMGYNLINITCNLSSPKRRFKFQTYFDSGTSVKLLHVSADSKDGRNHFLEIHGGCP